MDCCFWHNGLLLLAGEDPKDAEETANGAAETANGAAEPAADAPEAGPDLSYAQRVGAAFITFANLYSFMHADNGTHVKDIDRKARGDQAAQLAIDMQRAMLALIGSHRRRTYAHDLVYGITQLYDLFGRPWNAATEGNEHAHQDMKNYFHNLACHSSKKGKSDCYQVLRLMVIKQQLLEKYSHLLPHSQYAAMRANRVLAQQAKTKEGAARTGPKGVKVYKDDTRMHDTAQAMAKELELPELVCAPCDEP